MENTPFWWRAFQTGPFSSTYQKWQFGTWSNAFGEQLSTPEWYFWPAQLKTSLMSSSPSGVYMDVVSLSAGEVGAEWLNEDEVIALSSGGGLHLSWLCFTRFKWSCLDGAITTYRRVIQTVRGEISQKGIICSWRFCTPVETDKY